MTFLGAMLVQDVSKHFAKLKTQNLSTPRASKGDMLTSVASLDLMVQSLMMICDIGSRSLVGWSAYLCCWYIVLTKLVLRRACGESLQPASKMV